MHEMVHFALSEGVYEGKFNKIDKKNEKHLAVQKKLRTFAAHLRNGYSKAMSSKFLLCMLRRDVRVVECAGLENRCTARYRGFESLSLRQRLKPRKTTR